LGTDYPLFDQFFQEKAYLFNHYVSLSTSILPTLEDSKLPSQLSSFYGPITATKIFEKTINYLLESAI